MTVTATGYRGSVLQSVADMLAASEAFWAWVGANDAEEAADHIYQDVLPEPLPQTPDEWTVIRPFCVLWVEDFRRIWTGTGVFRSAGRVVVHFEQDAPVEEAEDSSEIERRFDNTLGAIMEDMEDAGESGLGCLPLVQIVMPQPPQRTSAAEARTLGDCQSAELHLMFGE